MATLSVAQSGQWLTFSHDRQRSGAADEEHAFASANISALALDWKTTVPNEPLFLDGLTAPLLVRGVNTKQGSRNLVLVAGSSDHVFAMDAETGELAWKVDLSIAQPRPQDGGWLCAYALNATPVIDPAHCRVFVIASDGRLHTLDLADEHASIPPLQFVPAFSKMWSLNYANGILYSSLSQDCNHANSGVAAINPDAPGHPVARFFSATNGGAGVGGRGGVSIGLDGPVYGATGDAPFDPAANEYGDTVFPLNPSSLELTGFYTPANWHTLRAATWTWAHRHAASGKGASGTRTPNFSDPDWQAGKSDSALLDALTKGTEKGMPAFGDLLTPAQREELSHCMMRGFARVPLGR